LSIRALLDKGCDLEADVLPTVARTVPALLHPLKSWGAQWLVREILDARERRLHPKDAAREAPGSQRVEEVDPLGGSRAWLETAWPDAVIRQRLLLDAAQGHVDPAADVEPVLALIDQGCDFEADILPTVARTVPELPRLRGDVQDDVDVDGVEAQHLLTLKEHIR
jgi:hypothetical protein